MADKSNHTVYVIMKGRYSDAHICMVTMDKKHAEDMRVLFSDRYDDAYIEDYVLDEYSNRRKSFFVEFSEEEPPEVHIDEYELYCTTADDIPHVTDNGYCVRIYVAAIDEENALKIAQDEYAQWKAEKDGYVL